MEGTVQEHRQLECGLRSVLVFDELKQSVKDIEFLSDPGTGQLTIGSAESIAGAILPPIIERFAQKYPHVVLNVEGVPSPAINSAGLLEHRYDLVLARGHEVDVPVDHLRDYSTRPLDAHAPPELLATLDVALPA